MLYEEKIEAVRELSAKFKDAPMAVLADYRGLTVAQVTELRKSVRAASGEFVVAKNTLAKIAIRDTPAQGIDGLLSGPTALVFGYSDAVGLAKALEAFAKSNEAFQLKGGVLDGETLDAAQVERLAKMPGRDQLRAQLLALLSTPATQLVRLLKAPAQQLVQVLEARRKEQE